MEPLYILGYLLELIVKIWYFGFFFPSTSGKFGPTFCMKNPLYMLKSYNLVQNLQVKETLWATPLVHIHYLHHRSHHYTEFCHDCTTSVGATSVRIVHGKMEVKMTFINKKMEKKMALIHNNWDILFYFWLSNPQKPSFTQLFICKFHWNCHILHPKNSLVLAYVLSASFGLVACLDFGPCPLFLFLALSWVLSFYKVWQGFITPPFLKKKSKLSQISFWFYTLIEPGTWFEAQFSDPNFFI
jgi:hypothetical protein